MKQQPNQNTATSILSRQTRLLNRLKELKLHVDLLDDDGQLSQSSGGIRDVVSMISSRGNRSRRSTPVSIDNNEDNQLRRNLEQQRQHVPPKSASCHPTSTRTTNTLSSTVNCSSNKLRTRSWRSPKTNRCKTLKSGNKNRILQESITTFAILSHNSKIHLSLTVQLVTISMPLSTPTISQARHYAAPK